VGAATQRRGRGRTCLPGGFASPAAGFAIAFARFAGLGPLVTLPRRLSGVMGSAGRLLNATGLVRLTGPGTLALPALRFGCAARVASVLFLGRFEESFDVPVAPGPGQSSTTASSGSSSGGPYPRHPVARVTRDGRRESPPRTIVPMASPAVRARATSSRTGTGAIFGWGSWVVSRWNDVRAKLDRDLRGRRAVYALLDGKCEYNRPKGRDTGKGEGQPTCLASRRRSYTVTGKRISGRYAARNRFCRFRSDGEKTYLQNIRF
jgi:hypothetical protein